MSTLGDNLIKIVQLSGAGGGSGTWSVVVQPNGDRVYTDTASGNSFIIPVPLVSRLLQDVDGDTKVELVENGGAEPNADKMNFVVDGVTVGSVEIIAGGITKWTLDGILDPIVYAGTPRTIAQRNALTPLAGYLVYVSDGATKEYQYYDGTAWKTIGAGGITSISDWTATTTYAAGNIVTIEGRTLRRISDGVSLATFDLVERATWEVITPLQAISPWSAVTYYYEGDTLNVNDRVFRCNTSHLSDGGNFGVDELTKWDRVDNISPSLAYQGSFYYYQGEQITEGGLTYKRLTAGTSGLLFDVVEQANWAIVGLYRGKLNNIAQIKALPKVNLIENEIRITGTTVYMWDKDFVSGAFQPDDTALPGVDTGYWVKIGSEYSGDYSSTEAYVVGDLVTYNNKLYKANVNREDGVWGATPIESDNQFIEVSGSIRTFNSNVSYPIGTLLYDKTGALGPFEGVYEAITTGFTGGNAPVQSNFRLVFSNNQFKGTFTSLVYAVGDIVEYQGTLYKAIVANGVAGLGTPFVPAEWTSISGGGASAQSLTWGQNYWSAFGTLSNAASTITTVATGSRSTLAPANQKLPMIGTTTSASGVFTGSGVTRDTTNNRFQITVAGRYNVSADIFGGPSGITQSALQLILNDTTIIAMSASGNTEAYSPLNLGWEGELSVGNTLELRVWTLGAGTYYHDGGTFVVSQQPTAVAPIIDGYSAVPLTYGRVNASADLTNTAFSIAAPGTKLPFNNTVYSSGVTFSGTDSIIPSVAGRYRASFLLIAPSGQFNGDGTVHIVQGGVSLGSVYIDFMEASGVNQSSAFIDVNVSAGTAVELRIQPDVADSIVWGRGSYFDLSQLPTAVAPVVDTVAEYIVPQYAAANVTPTSVQNTSANAAQFMAINIPSAGTWDIEWSVLGQVWQGNGGGTNDGIASGLYDAAGTFIANTELASASIASAGSTTGSNLYIQGTRSTTLVTTGATTFNVKVWNPNGLTRATAGSGVQGRSYIKANKIAGQLPSTGQTVDYVNAKLSVDSTGLAVNATIPFNTSVSGNIPVAAGIFSLTAGKTYDLEASLRIFRGSGGGFDARWDWVDGVTGVAITNQQSGHGYSIDGGSFTNGQSIAKLIYTPSVNQTVKLKFSVIAGQAAVDVSAADSWASITQIGSSALAGQTTIDGGVVFGNGTALVQDATNFFYNNTTDRLGIGTNNPVSKIQLTGDGNADFNNGAIRFQNTGASGRQWTVCTRGDAGGGNQRFAITDETATSERMGIDNNGKVFVGEVVGNTMIPGLGNAAMNLKTASGHTLNLRGQPNDTNIMNVYAGVTGDITYAAFFTDLGGIGTQRGTIRQQGANVAFNQTSDERLKTDTGKEAKGLEDLLKIKVRNYDWKGIEENSDGFFAQELHKIVPNAVSVGDNELDENGNLKNPWMVDYGKLTPILVKAVQDLTAKVAELEAKLNSK